MGRRANRRNRRGRPPSERPARRGWSRETKLAFEPLETRLLLSHTPGTDLRTDLTDEGLLNFVDSLDPGDERTGWIDVRHPVTGNLDLASLPTDAINDEIDHASLEDTELGYDRSSFLVNVDNKIITAKKGGSNKEAKPDIADDFEFANKILGQAGITVLNVGAWSVDLTGTLPAPFTIPLSGGTLASVPAALDAGIVPTEVVTAFDSEGGITLGSSATVQIQHFSTVGSRWFLNHGTTHYDLLLNDGKISVEPIELTLPFTIGFNYHDNPPTEQAMIQAHPRADAPTVNNWYATSATWPATGVVHGSTILAHMPYTVGDWRGPWVVPLDKEAAITSGSPGASVVSGLSQGTMIFDLPDNSTLAHELGHLLLDGFLFWNIDTVHANAEDNDLMHTGGPMFEPANLQDAGRNTAFLTQPAYLALKREYSSTQIAAMHKSFDQVSGVATHFVQHSAGENTSYGDRVDFHWVEDNQSLSKAKAADFSSLSSSLPSEWTQFVPQLDRMPDNPNGKGTEPLVFTTGSLDTPDMSGHDLDNWLMACQGCTDQQTLAAYPYPTISDPGSSFNVVDVFSIIAQFADNDGNSTDSDSERFREAAALDYQVEFLDPNGKWKPGRQVEVFPEGWTTRSHADDYLARWWSPFSTTTVRVEALADDGQNDGNTQIDAVVAGMANNSISGKVFQETPEVVPDGLFVDPEKTHQEITVKLIHSSDSDKNREVQTDENGNYAFIDVEAGDYHLDFKKPRGEKFTLQGADTTATASHVVGQTGVTNSFTVSTSSHDVRNAGSIDFKSLKKKLDKENFQELKKLLEGTKTSGDGASGEPGADTQSSESVGLLSLLTSVPALPDLPFVDFSLTELVDFDALFTALVDGLHEPISLAASAVPSASVLSQDAVFLVSIDGQQVQPVRVQQANTVDNTSPGDLAADLDLALFATDLGAGLQAVVLDDGRLAIETSPGETLPSLSVSTLMLEATGAGDPDVAQFGQLDIGSGPLTTLSLDVTRPQYDQDGNSLPAAVDSFTIEKIGITPPGPNEDPFAYTEDNATLQELADDLNLAFLAEGLTSVMVITNSASDRLALVATDPTVERIDVAGGSRLGFSDGFADFANNTNSAWTEMKFDGAHIIAEPNFFSVDSFVQAAVDQMEILSNSDLPEDFEPDPSYDELTDTLEFNFALSHVFSDIIELDLFEGVDLGSLLGTLEIAALADADLSVQVDLDFRVGMILGELAGNFDIDSNTLLSELNGGDGVNLLVGMTADLVTATSGQIGSDVSFALTFGREGGDTQVVSLTLLEDPDPADLGLPSEQRKPNTDDNSSLAMLAADLNRLFSQTTDGASRVLSDVVQADLFESVDMNGNVTKKLMLRAIDPSVRQLTVSGADLLGFTGTLDSHYDDLVFDLHDGHQFAVNLDGASDLGDVQQTIEQASKVGGIATVQVDINTTDDVIEVVDLTTGSDLFTIGPASTTVGEVQQTSAPFDFDVTDSHQSPAGMGLGILGTEQDVDTNEDGVAEIDGIITGDALHGLDSSDRIYIVEQAAGQATDHEHVKLTATVQSDIDVTAALGEIAFDIATAADDPFWFSVGAGIHLNDPNSDNEILISEVTPANLVSIVGLPAFSAAAGGTVELAVNVFDADDKLDLDALLGETDPVVTLSFGFDTNEGQFTFSADANFQALTEQIKNLGVEDFVGLLNRLVDELQNNPDLPFLEAEIPILNQSVNDVLNFADGVLDAANRIVSFVDLDEVDQARQDLETVVNNLDMSVEARSPLFRQLDVLRRVAKQPDQDLLVNQPDFLDRLPTRLLSATAQLGKLINRYVPDTTTGYYDLIAAYKSLLQHVPALNSLAERLANALEGAINDALATPAGSPLNVNVELGFADFDGVTDTAAEREDRMVVLGIELDAAQLVEKTFEPAMPLTAEVGPVSLELDASLNVVAGGTLAIGLAIDPRKTVDDERFFLVVNPPDSSSDNLVKTSFSLNLGLDASATGEVGFGSIGLIEAEAEFTLLAAHRQVVDDPPTAFVNNVIQLDGTPAYYKEGTTQEDDGRFMIVAIKDEIADQVEVLSFSDGEYRLEAQGSGPPELEIVESTIDLADATEVVIEYQSTGDNLPGATPGPQDPARVTNHPANISFEFLPTLGSLTQRFSNFNFSTSAAIESMLDAGSVDGQIVSDFATAGITLANTLPIDVQEEGERWHMTSGTEAFTLVKNGSQLDVYDLPNALGAVAFGKLGSETDVQIDLEGLLLGSIDGEFLGNDVDNILVVAASLHHLLQPQLTFDTDALGDLFKLDFDLKTIVAGIDKFLEELDEVLTDKVTSAMPLAGDGMDTEESFIGKLRTHFTQPLLSLLCDTGGTLEEVAETIQRFIFEALGPGLDAVSDPQGIGLPAGQRILGDRDASNTIDLDDVSVVLTEDKFEIEIQLAGRDEFLLDFNFGSGFPLQGEGGLEFGWDFTLDLGVGVARDEGFYFLDAAANEPELKLVIGAGLAVDDSDPANPVPTSLTLDLFGLELSATDILNGTSTGTQIVGTLEINVTDANADGHISTSELTSRPFSEVFDARMEADVDVNLKLAAGVNDNLPSIETDLYVDWSASLMKNIQTGDYEFSQAGLEVKFLDLGINLGDFLTEHIGPVVQSVDKYIEPIKPIVELLTTEVPGVSQLSEAAGNGPVDFLDLAFIKNPSAGEDARKFVDVLVIIIDVIETLSAVGPGDNLFVVLSSVECVLGPPCEPPIETSLALADAGSDREDAGTHVVTGSDGAIQGIQNVQGKLNGLLERLHDMGIVIHLLEDPGNIVSLIMGQPFDVVSWDLPRFELPFTWEIEFPVWTPPKIDVRIGLDAEIFADFSVGYDSHGLDTGNFFHGFYFGDREEVFVGPDIDEFGLGLGVRVAALLDLLVVQAGVEGEIRADFFANWRDSNDDGKLHADEIGSIVRNDGLECLFDLRGEITAIVRLVWEFTVTGSTGGKEFINEVLFSFMNKCPKYETGHVSEGETLPGITADVIALDSSFADFNQPGTLVLHAGPFAGQRGPGSTSDTAEAFEVEEDAPGVYTVRALGLESRYSGVERIYFSGGNKNDRLELIDVSVPVAAFGGADDDILHGTRNTDLLDGGPGSDEIYARGDVDYVFGGSGDDVIYGDLEAGNTDTATWGSGAGDFIDAGPGDDLVFAADGDDTVEGGSGNDTIWADMKEAGLLANTTGNDIVNAGSGDDSVYGGPGDDVLAGDQGRDIIVGQAGDDQISGGTGQDVLLGNDGADDVRGGGGIDLVVGGSDADEVFGDGGNDVVVGGLISRNNSQDVLRDDVVAALGFVDLTLIDQFEAEETGVDGDDDLWGGTDNDFLIGDEGADRLFGGWGRDLILAHEINTVSTAHAEYIEGGPGDDFICGAEGIDTIFGGTSDPGLDHILATGGATPTQGGYSITSCQQGIVSVQTPTTDSVIDGFKFNDENGNGTFDAGEGVFADWTILLEDAGGETVASTVTDADGYYTFGDLTAGDYVVREEDQTDWLQTAGGGVGLDAMAADTNGVLFGLGGDSLYKFDDSTLTWAAMTTEGCFDAMGFASDGRLLATGRGDSRVFELDQTTGVAQVAITTSFPADGGMVASADGNTLYLSTGSSLVRVDPFNGISNTVGDHGTQLVDLRQGTDGSLYAIDSAGALLVVDTATGLASPLPAGTVAADVQLVEGVFNELVIAAAAAGEYEFALLPGQTVSDVNFGNQFNGATIHGQKWHDLDGDGEFDTNEPGLDNWVIELLDEAGSLIASTHTYAVDLDGSGSDNLDNDGDDDTSTNVDDGFTIDEPDEWFTPEERGFYEFTGLPSGTYAVREVPLDDWIQTSPRLQDANTFVELADDGFSSTSSDALVDVTGGAITDVNLELNIEHPERSDLAVALISPSGTRLNLFSGVGGSIDNFSSITLDDGASNPIDDISSVQAANPATAHFRPQELLAQLNGEDPNGQWTLEVRDTIEGEAGRLLDWSLEITTDVSQPTVSGGEPNLFNPGQAVAVSISVAAGDDITQDFGNFRAASAAGTKFLDQNGNRLWDREGEFDGEPGYAGVTIYADLNGNYQLDRGEPQTLTQLDDPTTFEINETGQYLLEPLPPGTYRIQEVVTDGLEQTFPGFLAAIEPGYQVNLVSGQAVENLDFGNRPPASVHGVKWFDQNGNGIRDEGEPGLNGVTIYADLNNNSMLDDGEPYTLTMSMVIPVPPTVTRVTRDSGTETFGSLDTLAFTFDADVNVTAAALSLLNETEGAAPVDLSGVVFSYQAASRTATWDFTGVAGIDIAFYTVLLDAMSITTNSGIPLDGDGDGTGGDDFSHVLLVARTGDSDIDGDVDLADYNQLATNFDPLGFTPPHRWCDANFDNDQDIDLSDYNTLVGNLAPLGYAGTTPALYVAPTCGLDSEPLAAATAGTMLQEDGHYWLEEVPSGNVVIREIPGSGYVPTFPTGGFYQLDLAIGENREGVDFGNAVDQTPQQGTITGHVVIYEALDSVPGNGEVPQPGVIVFVDMVINGVYEPGLGELAGISEDNGVYVINNVPVGTWEVREIVPAEFLQVYPAAAPQHTVTVTSGATVTGIDFANIPFPDSAAVEVADSSLAPSGLVALWDFEGDGIDTADHYVENVGIFDDDLSAFLPSGISFVSGLVGPKAAHIEPNSRFQTTITGDLALGSFTIETFVKPGQQTSGAIFETVDQGLTLTTDDFRVSWAGGHVSLSIFNGGTLLGTPITASLPSGVWSHVAVTGNGTDLTLFVEGAPVGTISHSKPIGIDAVDQLQIGSREFRGDFDKTAVWDLPLDTGVLDNHAINPGACYDLTPLQSGDPGSIHGYKFNDLNGNGQWDLNEPPLEGWVIELTGGDLNGDEVIDDNDVLTMATKTKGEYWFTNLVPAIYTVTEVQQVGWVQTTTGGIGSDGLLTSVAGSTDWTLTLGSGDLYTHVDFGNQYNPDDNSIHGQKWHDENANGDRDPGEEGLDGWEIELYNDLGELVATTATMSMDLDGDFLIDPETEQGLFWFTNLPAGSYQVGEVLLPGWVQTVPGVENELQPGDANQDGRYDEADLMQVLEWDLFGTGQPADWFQGDFTRDGIVDEADRDAASASGNLDQGPYFSDQIHRIETVIVSGQVVDSLQFANFLPTPLPDGDDVIFASDDADVLYGDNLVSDPTVYSVGTRRDEIFGQNANDRIFGQEEDDIVWGADETLGVVAAGQDEDFIVGGLGIDEVRQTVDADQTLTDIALDGQGSDELISIEQAVLTGGTTNNQIDASGFSGPVQLFGLEGDDTLIGGPVNDRLDGGGGSDFMLGNDGDDVYLFGPVPGSSPLEEDKIQELASAGIDTLDFSGLDTGITVDLTSSLIAQQPGTGNVREVNVETAGQEANFEHIVGTEFDDILTGNNLANTIVASGGSDQVDGQGSDDVIDLGAGLNESASTGTGNDVVLFADDWGSATVSDSGGDDTLDFSGVTVPLTFSFGSLAVTDGTNTVTHVNNEFEHVIGGQQDDQFVFADMASLPGAGTIDGRAGTDLLDYTAYTSGVIVDLSTGSATGVPGGTLSVENVTGGQGFDQLTGDAGPNVLYGGPDSDLLFGLGGQDQLIGESGGDLLDGGEDSDLYILTNAFGNDYINDSGTVGTDELDLTAVTADLDFVVGAPADPTHTRVSFQLGGAELALFTGSIERVVSGSGNDVVEFHDTSLLSGAELDGGSGIDWLSYANMAVAVEVNLSTAPFEDPAVLLPATIAASSATGTSSIANFENAIGSAQDDLLVGSDGPNELRGGLGDDRLFGLRDDDTLQGGFGSNRLAGGAGDDVYIVTPLLDTLTLHEDRGVVLGGQVTGGGNDTIDFSLWTQNLTFDLSSNDNTVHLIPVRKVLLRLGNGNAVDTAGSQAYDNFENVIGSQVNTNVLTGNSQDNWLIGGSFSDTLTGGDGDDVLVGSAGGDSLAGEAGNDILLGGAGADGDSGSGLVFAGGPGRDILVGGDDADQINADDDEEDILISGSTAYEDIAGDATHQNAWEQILATWQSATKSRTVRESSISSGVGTTGQGGPFRLDPTTVFDDGAIDDLTYDSIGAGSPVDDWLMGDIDDIVLTSLVAAGDLEDGIQISSVIRIDVPANVVLPTPPIRSLEGNSPGPKEANDVKTNRAVKRSATREAVTAAFAQYEHDQQSFGTVAASRSEGESLDLSLAEPLDQRESERVRKLFAE